MDYLKNNEDISFVALYHNSEVPSSSDYHSHPSGRPPNDGRRSLAKINADLTMTVPGRMESISQPEQEAAILSEYQNSSEDAKKKAMMDKTTFEYIQHSRISQGVSPTTQLLLSSAWGIRSQIRRFRRYPETLYIDTTFKTNNEQRPFLMICGKDANGEIYIFLRIYLCSETAWQFRWCFSYVLPQMVGKDHLARVKMVITDGDIHEYSQVDAAISSAFTNARRGRCGYHLVELQVQKLPLRIEKDAVREDRSSFGAQRTIFCEWCYSWMRGGTENQAEYNISRKLLLRHLSQPHVKLELGTGNAEELTKFIHKRLLPWEQWFLFHLRKFCRHHDATFNCPAEAMNGAVKKAQDLRVSGNMTMTVAAQKQERHTHLSERNKDIRDATLLNSSANYIKHPTPEKDLDQIVQMAVHEFHRQYKERNNYSWVRMSDKRWFVMRNTFNTEQDDYIPRFARVREVNLTKECYMHCDCGYHWRYGIPCRHVLSIDDTFVRNDFAVRWWKVYGYYSFKEGQEELTKDFLDLEQREPPGKKINPSLMEVTGTFPQYSTTDTKCKHDFRLLRNRTTPWCLNYAEADYCETMLYDGLSQEGLLTQESNVSLDGTPFPSGEVLFNVYHGDRKEVEQNAYNFLHPHFKSLVAKVEGDWEKVLLVQTQLGEFTSQFNEPNQVNPNATMVSSEQQRYSKQSILNKKQGRKRPRPKKKAAFKKRPGEQTPPLI
jgi:hypothetical protein